MSEIKITLWYVYMIRCCDKSLYTGITTDISRRLAEHNAQGKKAAKYLRGKQPLELVFQLSVANKSIALQTEYKIKQLTKSDKETLIRKMRQNKHSCIVSLIK